MAANKRINELEERSSATSGMKLAAYDPATDTTVALLVSAINPEASEESFAYDSGVTYNEDDVVVYSDQIYISLQDGNLDNPPDEVGSVFWTLGVRAVSGLVPWAAGVFTDTHVTVLNDAANGVRSLYSLKSATRPYNSTDFDAELLAGDWVVVRDPRSITNCGEYNGGASDDEYPNPATNDAKGSGAANVILKNDEFSIPASGVTIDRGSGAEFVPYGVTLRALVDTPGTTPANWKSY